MKIPEHMLEIIEKEMQCILEPAPQEPDYQYRICYLPQSFNENAATMGKKTRQIRNWVKNGLHV